MLNTLAAAVPNRQVTFVHAAQNGDLHAMKQHVEELAAKYPQVSAFWCYEQPTERDRIMSAYHKEGYIDLPWLKTVVPTKESNYYFCGPLPFMKAVNNALEEWGVPGEDIHYEFFGPAGSLADTSGPIKEAAAGMK